MFFVGFFGGFFGGKNNILFQSIILDLCVRDPLPWFEPCNYQKKILLNDTATASPYLLVNTLSKQRTTQIT